MSGGGGSSGGSNTVTQVQQIPDWQKDFAQQNEQIAASLASRPYPTYKGDLIAGFTPQQTQGMQMTQDAANSYQPAMDSAQKMTASAAQPWNAQTAQQYMSPYAMAALAPQMQQLHLQQAQQRKAIGANATQAGAFGDARHGVAESLNDFYGNLAQNDLVGQGMNSAYNSGLNAFQQGQQQQLAAGGQMANIGGQRQQLGLQGATAVFDAGTQQQQLKQQQLSTAYQNFLNQANWPTENLNLRIASLANSPYSMTNYTSLAPANATAMNVGAFGALAGGVGSLLNGQGGGATAGKVFGG